MPTTEACARCAEPKASQTKTPSQSAASCLEKFSSFFSSSGWKRTFSSTRTSPSRSALLWPSTPGPTQSLPKATGLPSRSSSFFAAGRSEYFGSGPPFGRPKCDASTRRPPFSIANCNVGKVSRMRVSSVTTPSFSGTLKSTRRKTRLLRNSKSLIVSLFIFVHSLGGGGFRPPRMAFQPKGVSFELVELESRRQELDQVAATARIAPLIVVPRQHLYALFADNFSVIRVDDR